MKDQSLASACRRGVRRGVVYADEMRCPDGGGLTAHGRAKREAVRLQAAELFARDMSAVEVAGPLRVSTKSAYAWQRDWIRGGTEALASQSPTGGPPCRLRAASSCIPAMSGRTSAVSGVQIKRFGGFRQRGRSIANCEAR
jgi:hypothetical protein